MNALRLLGATLLIMAGLFLTAILGDLLFPLDPIEVKITPEMIIYPEDSDDVAESAWSLGVDTEDLTVEEFLEHDSLGTMQEVREYMNKRAE